MLRPYQTDAVSFLRGHDRALVLGADTVRALLSYDCTTGVFWWRKSGTGRNADLRAGYVNPKGYVCIEIQGREYKAHRLAWIYVTGVWPTHEIDHINGVRNDNRWVNLREATIQEQAQNKRRQKNSTSGYAGVSWHKRKRKWVAYIGHGGRLIHLGQFDNKLDAVEARTAAKHKLHTFHPEPN